MEKKEYKKPNIEYVEFQYSAVVTASLETEAKEETTDKEIWEEEEP